MILYNYMGAQGRSFLLYHSLSYRENWSLISSQLAAYGKLVYFGKKRKVSQLYLQLRYFKIKLFFIFAVRHGRTEVNCRRIGKMQVDFLKCFAHHAGTKGCSHPYAHCQSQNVVLDTCIFLPMPWRGLTYQYTTAYSPVLVSLCSWARMDTQTRKHNCENQIPMTLFVFYSVLLKEQILQVTKLYILYL